MTLILKGALCDSINSKRCQGQFLPFTTEKKFKLHYSYVRDHRACRRHFRRRIACFFSEAFLEELRGQLGDTAAGLGIWVLWVGMQEDSHGTSNARIEK